MEILNKETFAPRSFLLSRLAIFGERESAEALSALRIHSLLVSKLDHYRNVEIEEIPVAADVREDLRLDFLPDDPSKYWCKLLFRPLRYTGAVPQRDIQNEEELEGILQSLQMREDAQKRILKSVRDGRPDEGFVPNIGLDTLYRLNLVWL